MVPETSRREQKSRAGKIGMERRWGVVKLSDLTPDQARIIRALVENMRPRADEKSAA